MDLRGMLPSLPTKKTAKANLVILVVFWLLWGSVGGPWGKGWVMPHPRRVMGWDKSN